jgi:hypothetical protein
MQETSLILADFMDLFAGDTLNFGVHAYKFTDAGKEAGTNSTVTNRLLTMEEYKEHLAGNKGLGIIPINEKNEVKFGVIDLDVYDSDLQIYVDAIERNNLPLVPFKSKSGGLHLYMFVRSWVSAKSVVEILHSIVNVLNLDLYIKHKLNRIIEIFPKQTKLAQGGVGSWINLPYYNEAKTRQCAIRSGKELSLSEALAYAKAKRVSLTEARTLLNELPYTDAPPCLQTIHLLDVMGKNSGRNNYLFSFAVYLKKKEPEFWEQRLYEVNNTLQEPLKRDEVEGTILNSLRKKDYTYKCNEQPCVEYCRRELCKKRDFGIGKEGGYFSELEYGALTQIRSAEPYYEWEVKLPTADKFTRMRFKSEADIIGQDVFLRLCFRDLHILPIKIKQVEWYKLINQALAEVKVVDVDQADDASAMGMFKQLFQEYLTDRAMAATKDQILTKRAYHDEMSHKYYFRAIDLSNYVFVSKMFRYFAPADIHGVLRDFGAVATRIKTESGKQLRVYEISEEALEKVATLSMEPFEAKFVDKSEDF